ncbi:TetR/AcrR family transcriptional regulator [Arthrobacter sp. zg-Y820]|uniref:TetR/AcrR family transcriptional regulator n=1 Tax=unclassified Arthrobacter TaxID=235627 RepID=UPI0022B16F6D|nr:MULTISPECIES: TetR/AcrR family transcriptional regulator [unclassified Arthrobacter]MDK1278152.1 TetR/AcrR family transcriptional regulator [Arthrobacter sp. zg.Y820]WIB10039.1 TetR/AcrR family transcriptional regulator [Arthrobacter sp. zg-Y820]
MSRTERKGEPVPSPGAALPARNGGSDWRTYAPDDLSPILASALECFMEHGYHGTTIRQVAARCGLSVPGLYHHYPSKHALLVAITSHAMSDLWLRSEQALAEAGESVSDQFDSLVECLVLFHARRTELAFIAFSEIRSLDGSAHSEHIAARDRQQGLMNAVVEQGAKTGVFTTRFPREASMAVITMCTGVAQWFRPGGALTPEQLVERYREISSMAVGR